MRALWVFGVFVLVACKGPPPEVTALVERQLGRCGEASSSVRFKGPAGTSITLPVTSKRKVVIEASGEVRTPLAPGEILFYDTAPAELDGHKPATVKLTYGGGDQGFERGGEREQVFSVCGGRCQASVFVGKLRLQNAKGGQARFGGVTVADEGSAELDPLTLVGVADLARLKDEACKAAPVAGLEVDFEGRTRAGSLWVSGAELESALGKALQRLDEGQVPGGAEVTGKSGVLLRYKLVEGYFGPPPTKLSDIRYVATRKTDSVKIGSCGLYTTDRGEKVQVDRRRMDTLARVYERHTGKVIAEKRYVGEAGGCATVKVGIGDSYGDSHEPEAVKWLQARLTELVAAP